MPPAASRAAEAAAPPSLDYYLKHSRYGAVDLEVNDDQFLVRAELGGKKRMLLVDTGWTMTTLSPGAAKGLKTLRELGGQLEDTFLGRLTNGSLVVMDKLALGQAQFFNQPAEVSKLKAEYMHVPFSGALGLDFFLRNHCLIDVAAQRLYFRAAPPTTAESDALAETLRRSGFVAVPMDLQAELTVDATFNDRPMRLVVDTGAVWSVLHEPWAKELGLTALKRDRPDTGTYIHEDYRAYTVGIGVARQEIRVATVKTLQIGPRKWNDVHFGMVNLKGWGIEQLGRPGREVHGLLGLEMLGARKALIDSSSLKLWFGPETEPSKPAKAKP